MTRLSVNINKVALIRNARGGGEPDLCKYAKDCEAFGAEGITVHPRPDERHVKFGDIPELKKIVTTEFNIEGYPDRKFMQIVLETKPDQCTLVPDAPDVITSNSGWDTKKHCNFLKDIVAQIKEAGIRVSLFLNPIPKLVESAKETCTDRIELYTGKYASSYMNNKEVAIQMHRETADLAKQAGLGINAGHDLNLDNLRYYKENIGGLMEVSIGHALTIDAIYFGLQNAIHMYKYQLR